MSRAIRTVSLIGPGRAGTSVVGALVDAGWTVGAVAGRDPERETVRTAARQWGATATEVGAVAEAADLIVIATPDAEIAAVAEQLASTVRSETLVIHLSGARGLDALDALPGRTGALHPLQTFPARFEARVVAGSWCAVTGDPDVEILARELGMTPFSVPDADRARYHAAACVASNHLVALMAQVEAIAVAPREAFGPLVRATVEHVVAMGSAAALTGPVARGDVETVRAHLGAIPTAEREAYLALARRAAVLAGRAAEWDAVLR